MPGSSSVLDRIIRLKREEVARLQAAGDPGDMKARIRDLPPARDFLGALADCPHVPIIAEIKKASPSAGELKSDVQVGTWARNYRSGGAAALSVLTDGPFFNGTPDDLRAARRAVDIPVLRKDFMIDPLQIHETRLMGADAVLLIAAALAPAELADLYGLALDLGLTPLVEIHHESELKPVLDLTPRLMGINNRDLTTLEVTLETSLRLRPMIDAHTLVVAESGIQGPADVSRLLAGGLDAFLVGTTLMRAADPGAMLASLRRVRRDGHG